MPAAENGVPAVPRGDSVEREPPPSAHATQTVTLRSLEGLGDTCEGMAAVGSMCIAGKDVFAESEAILDRPMPPRPGRETASWLRHSHWLGREQ